MFEWVVRGYAIFVVASLVASTLVFSYLLVAERLSARQELSAGRRA